MDSLRSPTWILMPSLRPFGDHPLKLERYRNDAHMDSMHNSRSINTNLYTSLCYISPVLMGSLRPLIAPSPLESLGTGSEISKGIIEVLDASPAPPSMGSLGTASGFSRESLGSWRPLLLAWDPLVRGDAPVFGKSRTEM